MNVEEFIGFCDYIANCQYRSDVPESKIFFTAVSIGYRSPEFEPPENRTGECVEGYNLGCELREKFK